MVWALWVFGQGVRASTEGVRAVVWALCGSPADVLLVQLKTRFCCFIDRTL